MRRSGIELALWLAYRVSRFVLLLSVVLIGISAVLPDFISGRDGCYYAVRFGSVWHKIGAAGCGARNEVVNLWFLFVPAAMATAYFGIVSKLIAEAPLDGCCDRCGYNLTGNVSGRCPECGTAVLVAGATDDTDGHR
jgi:hypothetical protein